MKILFCSENFKPSKGGVQEVVYQIARRCRKNSFIVEIATSFREDRPLSNDGFKTHQYKIYGNSIFGYSGETEEYVNFIKKSDYDIIFIYAAQQWSFDLLIDHFNCISSKVVFVPCGLSALNQKIYKSYFNKIIKQIDHIDHFIFHTTDFQDFDFLKKFIPKNKISIIPNGADNSEFGSLEKKSFYKRLIDIKEPTIFLFSNSSMSYSKGQIEILNTFKKVRSEKELTLILNANIPSKATKFQFKEFILECFKYLYRALILKDLKFSNYLYSILVKKKIKKINKLKNKTVILKDLSRKDLLNHYKAADIFLFSSKIEYCPLVIYESMAASTAFISNDVGNVKSIIQKHNSGLLVKTNFKKDFSLVDLSDFQLKIEYLIKDSLKRNFLGKNGRSNFLNYYNWDNLYKYYLKIFKNV